MKHRQRKSQSKRGLINCRTENVVYCGSPFPPYKRLPTGPVNCDCGPSLDGGGDAAGPAHNPYYLTSSILVFTQATSTMLASALSQVVLVPPPSVSIFQGLFAVSSASSLELPVPLASEADVRFFYDTNIVQVCWPVAFAMVPEECHFDLQEQTSLFHHTPNG
jgi:hypothetical protein